ncbi:DUF1501 domain-containing protein [Blastopirellula retiformator]|uniref:Sulfatase n=1 Tax=Blastopirellula retiformator TaxID=2527970 RepID=A0A5C5V5J4_9BACT|nr:DUF1501 domain-containing protein [Blastopirellula retiformator]TWT33012.1 hypothetical protein Enr8_28310 [Blastopirellula retiformator]
MSHCHRFRSQPLSRRALLKSASCGFASVALHALLGDAAFAESDSASAPHHAAKAKNVIFLYMDGGPSQVDTFDPKPALAKYDGKPFPTKTEPTQFNNNGATLASLWKFNQYGESGLPISDLFPHLGTQADKLAMIHSMTSEFPEHTSANYFLHTGSGLQGRPSMGAWTTYGLGSDNQDLPGFVVLNAGLIPPGGIDNFNSGFLPAAYQGSIFNPGNPPVANIRPADRTADLQKSKLGLIERLDRVSQANSGGDDQLESAIRNYELAYRMQTAVPELMDLRDESKATLEMYGLNDEFKNTQLYGRQCLTARRLIERGVRFVELTCPGGNGDRWDQHSNLKDGHEKNAKTVDKPIAALLEDLQQRGLLDSTLVVFAGEFGRTPFAQGANGRDHNPFAFTIWMAGGGVQGGIRYGKSDEFGYKTVENRLMIHDLHATMLHLLGVDHEKLTFRFSGRDMRLTDVHGHVIHDILT